MTTIKTTFDDTKTDYDKMLDPKSYNAKLISMYNKKWFTSVIDDNIVEHSVYIVRLSNLGNVFMYIVYT